MLDECSVIFYYGFDDLQCIDRRDGTSYKTFGHPEYKRFQEGS